MGGYSSKPCHRRKILVLRKPVVYQKMAEDVSWTETPARLESVMVNSMCTVTLGVRIDRSNFMPPVVNVEEFARVHDFLNSDDFSEALVRVFHNFQNVSIAMKTHDSQGEWDLDLTAQLVLPEGHQSLEYIDRKLQELASHADIIVPGTSTRIMLLAGKKSLFASGLICDNEERTVETPVVVTPMESGHWDDMQAQLQVWEAEQRESDTRLFEKLDDVDEREKLAAF
jgi:hypothetical protein